MSGRSACWVPRNAPVAKSKTRFSYEGSLSAKPGVPGSGGRPTPGGKQSNSVGKRPGWMQVHPAAFNWPGVTPSALAVVEEAPAAASPTVKAISPMRPSHLVIVPLIVSLLLSCVGDAGSVRSNHLLELATSGITLGSM